MEEFYYSVSLLLKYYFCILSVSTLLKYFTKFYSYPTPSFFPPSIGVTLVSISYPLNVFYLYAGLKFNGYSCTTPAAILCCLTGMLTTGGR